MSAADAITLAQRGMIRRLGPLATITDPAFDALRAAMAVHTSRVAGDGMTKWCSCGHLYPCPTVRAIEDVLNT